MSAWKPRFCQWCGKAIKRPGGGKDSKKYCCKPCYFNAVRAGTQQFRGRCHDLSAALADWALEWDAKRPRPRKARLRKARPSCETCGNEVNHGASRFCSYDCVKAWRGVRQCEQCGTDVPGSTSFSRCRCDACKTKLRKEANQRGKKKYGRNHRQRARRAGVSYVSIPVRAVYERDGWRCQICNRKCRKTFMVNKQNGRPHPRSPTLDHIRSLKDGGNHEPCNVQLACFECNTRKGAASRGQLRLSFT
jgi:hypothetical protein